MQRIAQLTGGFRKLGLGAVALAVVTIPAASALATSEDPTAGLTAEQIEQGRALFNDNACNSCHVLADAGASGTIGPAFDGNPNLDKTYSVNVITNGQAAMPSFSWLDPADIDLLAAYIIQTKK